MTSPHLGCDKMPVFLEEEGEGEQKRKDKSEKVCFDLASQRSCMCTKDNVIHRRCIPCPTQSRAEVSQNASNSIKSDIRIIEKEEKNMFKARPVPQQSKAAQL